MKYNMPKIEIPEGAGSKLVKVGLLVGLVILGKRALANGAKDSADAQVTKDPAAGQARILATAMNPTGYKWLWYVDGANSALILSTAEQIKDLDSVMTFYKAQTKGDNLLDDLKVKLSTSDYDKFIAITTNGKSGSLKYLKNRTDMPANLWVLTTTDANIRKTAKKESRFKPGNNIVKTVAKGKIIGISTGKYSYDESGDTTFIEFWTLGAKAAGRQFFYVAKSQVELLTKEQRAAREKNGSLPMEILAGVSATNQPDTQAVTVRVTRIYSEDFKPLPFIPANLIVGFPLLTLDTGAGRYTKIHTVQGFTRWVKTEDIRIQQRY